MPFDGAGLGEGKDCAERNKRNAEARRVRKAYEGLDGPEGTDLAWHMRQYPWIPLVFKEYISTPNLRIHQAADNCGYWNMRYKAAEVAKAYEWRAYRRWFYAERFKVEKQVRLEWRRKEIEIRRKERMTAKQIVAREMRKVEDAARLMHPDTYAKFLFDQERKAREAMAKAMAGLDFDLAEKCLKMIEMVRSLYVKLYGEETPLLDVNLEFRHPPAGFLEIPDPAVMLQRSPEEQARLDRIQEMLGKPRAVDKPVPDLLIPAHLFPRPGTLEHQIATDSYTGGMEVDIKRPA